MRHPIARFLPRLALASLALFLALAPVPAAGQVPAPATFFGFPMGSDGQLAAWPEIARYFDEVAKRTDRVRIVEVGPTTDGNRMIAALVSAPENIAKLDSIREANRALADPRGLAPEEALRLAADHRVVVAIGCSIHATEVAATQAAVDLLYELATAADGRTAAILRDVVLVLIPSLNPDGHGLVIDWWRRFRGTPFEGNPMPWLYQRYAGHDINRDAFMMNLAENRSLARFFYREWHPQVFLSMHQMGTRGPRFFVPPNYDPIDPNYDPLIWREAALLGGAMTLELERRGRSGVVSNAMYDYYWPGYEDSAPLGHNTVCLLTEAASARLSSPVTVEAKDLVGSPRGLVVYAPQINFPNPWPGGTWRLRDIIDYELDAVRGLLTAASRYRRDLVENFYEMGRRAVERGASGSPFAYIIPPDQADPWAASRLVGALIDGKVDVFEAREPVRAGSAVYTAGTRLVMMAQPFRAYAKTLLERQSYPVRRLSPGAPPERPYDVTGWTLPYQLGVRVDVIDQAFEPPLMTKLERASVRPAQIWGDRNPRFYIVDGRGTAGALAVSRLLKASLPVSWTPALMEVNGFRYAAGALVVPHSKPALPVLKEVAEQLGLRIDGVSRRMPTDLKPIGRARVGLYKPWTANIDEGWTRWTLEQYEFPFRTIADVEIRRGRLKDALDVIILPDAAPEQLVAGNKPETSPVEYTGGLGAEGVAALRAFVEEGGTLVCLDSSGGLAIDALKLPVKDILRGLTPDRFFCPGSIVKISLDAGQPLGFGMPADSPAFFANGSAYDVLDQASSGAAPGSGGTRPTVSVVARYAAGGVLMSGWLEGQEVIAGRPAVVEARAGKGRAILIGFRAQHRAQSLATFRFLFNAIFTATP